jgi:hypothetical protein
VIIITAGDLDRRRKRSATDLTLRQKPFDVGVTAAVYRTMLRHQPPAAPGVVPRNWEVAVATCKS